MNSRPRTWPFLVSALGLLVLLVATFLVFERTYFGQVIDERAFSGAGLRSTVLFRLSGMVLGALPVVAVAGSAVIVAIVASAARRFTQLVIAVLVAGISFAVAEVLKHVLLTRAETGATWAISNSFPSGHTTTAAAAAFAVFLVVTPRWRPLAGVLGGAVAAVVGLATLVQHWHRPSDVVGGLLLVAACGCLGGAFLTIRRAVRPFATAPRVVALWWLGGICGAVSLAAFLALRAAAGVHLQIAFLGGSTAILATASLLTAGGIRAFRRIA